MAGISRQVTHLSRSYGSDAEVDADAVAPLSDYGSEFDASDVDEDTLLADVLGSITQKKPPHRSEKQSILPSIEFEEGEVEDRDDNGPGGHRPTVLRVAKGSLGKVGATQASDDSHSSPMRRRGPATVEVEYDEPSRRSWSVPLEKAPLPTHAPAHSRVSRSRSTLNTPEVVTSDSRPPLERFRTKPKKPLSVTDLVSPAWCELQYLYTLSKFGRKPQTKAMRTGSKIHKKLEDETHTTVPVQVQSSEDRFGLRLWNTISGLRCLRETGLTRELEVWGVIEGQVVNGVIDEVSHQCPDFAISTCCSNAKAQISGGTASLPSDQPSILQAFAHVAGADSHGDGWIGDLGPDRQIYIADVKTRSVSSVPTGASLRPVWMQLMLYRKLLELLTLNVVDAETIFGRYSIRPLEPFTEMFMEAIGGIGLANEAVDFPNLLSLWSLLITEMQLTFSPSSLSPILRVEYRYGKTGEVIGSELTVYEEGVIGQYIAEKMAWWKGKREAKGVEIEEAFKCRICDFADECSWRKAKVDESMEKSRMRREAREKSAV